jgi:tetratricopeptide (TPR) repeat protein
LFFLLFSWQAFTNKLISRQFYHDFEKDYTIFNFLLGTAVIIFISLTNVFKKKLKVLVYLLLALQIAFTLWFESPDSHENGERKILNATAAMIKNIALDKEKVYTNHSWYFYTTGTDILDTNRRGTIDSTILKKLRRGNVVVWENHYTNPNYTNTPVNYLLGDQSLIPLKDFVDSSTGFTTVVLVKEFNDIIKTENLLTTLIRQYPEDASSFYYYGYFLLQKKNNFNEAIGYFDKALLLNRQWYFAYYLRGFCYLKINDRNKACNDLKIAAAAQIPDAKQLLEKACH